MRAQAVVGGDADILVAIFILMHVMFQRGETTKTCPAKAEFVRHLRIGVLFLTLLFVRSVGNGPGTLQQYRFRTTHNHISFALRKGAHLVLGVKFAGQARSWRFRCFYKRMPTHYQGVIGAKACIESRWCFDIVALEKTRNETGAHGFDQLN
jgi:hypothetical protein